MQAFVPTLPIPLPVLQPDNSGNSIDTNAILQPQPTASETKLWMMSTRDRVRCTLGNSGDNQAAPGTGG